VSEIETPIAKPYVKPAWHIYTVLLKSIDRDVFFSVMRGKGIGVNLHYIPIYRFLYYQENFNINPKDFPVTEEVFSKIVTLPLFPRMTEENALSVIETPKKLIDRLKRCT